MIRTFKAQTTINVDSNTAWDAFSSTRFVKDFLPEIYKDILGLNLFYLARHKNGLEVTPAYVVPNRQFIGIAMPIQLLNSLGVT
jgi:hypothetical protein